MTDERESDDERTDAEEFEEHGVTHAVLRFKPQQWETRAGDKYAVQAGEQIEYVVPVEDVLDDDGNLITERTYEMDRLKGHENAPSAVKGWSGPFEIYYNGFYSVSDLPDDVPMETVAAVVTFYPEIPVDGELVVPDDTWTFEVPAEMAITDDGTVVEDDTDASDRLARYEHAPEIVRRWTEFTDWCFKITIDKFRVGETEMTPDTFEDYIGEELTNED